MVRTSEGLISDSPYTNLVYFVSIWPKDGVYINEYIIDNCDNRPYTLIVRQSDFFFESVEVYVYGVGVSIRVRVCWIDPMNDGTGKYPDGAPVSNRIG